MSAERSQDLLHPPAPRPRRHDLEREDGLRDGDVGHAERRLAASIRTRRGDPFALVGWLHGLPQLDRPLARILVLRELGLERGGRLLRQAFGGGDPVGDPVIGRAALATHRARPLVRDEAGSATEAGRSTVEQAVEHGDRDVGRAEVIASAVWKLLHDRDPQAPADALTLIESLEPSLRPMVADRLRGRRLGAGPAAPTAEEVLARFTDGRSSEVFAGRPVAQRLSSRPLGRREGLVSSWLDRTAPRPRPVAGGRVEAALDQGARRLGRFAERLVAERLGGRAVTEARALADTIAGELKITRPPAPRRAAAPARDLLIALDRAESSRAIGAEERRVLGRADGDRLPYELERRLAQLLGHDFSHVRIHTDEAAAATAERLGANALTVGSQIFFNRGAFAPGTPAGDRLLVHELTHVVQHDQGRLPRGGQGYHVTSPSDGVEREAKAAESKATRLPQAAAPRPAHLEALSQAERFRRAEAQAVRAVGAAEQRGPRRRAAAPEVDATVAGGWREAASTAWDYTGGAYVRGARYVGGKIADGARAVGGAAVEIVEEGAELAFRRLAPAWFIEMWDDPEGIAGYIKRRVGQLVQSGLDAIVQRFRGVVDFGKALLELANAFDSAFDILSGGAAKQQACCETFAKNIQTIREFGQRIVRSKALGVLRAGLQKLGEVFSWITRALGGGLFDLLKTIGGGAWQLLVWLKDGFVWLWGQIRSWGERIAKFVTGLLSSIGLPMTGEGGILSWFERLLAPLWEQIKRTFSLENLKAIGLLVVDAIALEPLRRIWDFVGEVVRVGEEIGDAWKHRNDPAFLRDAGRTGGLRNLLAKLFNRGSGLLDKIGAAFGRAAGWIGSVFGAIGRGIGVVVNALESNSWFKGFASLFKKATDFFNGIVEWASTAFKTAIESVTSVAEKAWHFLEPIVGVLIAVPTALVSPVAALAMIGAWFWNRLDPCVKEPIVDLLLDMLIGAAEAGDFLLSVLGPLAILRPLSRALLGFLRGVRRHPKRVQLFDGLARLLSSPAALGLAFVKGFVQGVVDNVIFPFEVLWMGVKAVAWVGGLLHRLGQQAATQKGGRVDVAAARGQSVESGAAAMGDAPAMAAMAAQAGGAHAPEQAQAPGQQAGAEPEVPGFLESQGAKLLQMAREMKASFDALMDATKGGLVAAIRGAFQEKGSGLSFQQIAETFSGVWNKVLDKIESMAGDLGGKMVDAFARAGDAIEALKTVIYWVGYIAGTIIFQVVLDVLTAGAYTFIGPVVMAIAKFVNFPAKLLGPMFELFGKFGRLIPGFVKNLGASLGKGAFSFLEKVMGPLTQFAERLVKNADELAGMWARAGTAPGAGVARRMAVRTASATGLVRTGEAGAARGEGWLSRRINPWRSKGGAGAAEREAAEQGTEHGAADLGKPAHAPEPAPTAAHAEAAPTAAHEGEGALAGESRAAKVEGASNEAKAGEAQPGAHEAAAPTATAEREVAAAPQEARPHAEGQAASAETQASHVPEGTPASEARPTKVEGEHAPSSEAKAGDEPRPFVPRDENVLGGGATSTVYRDGGDVVKVINGKIAADGGEAVGISEAERVWLADNSASIANDLHAAMPDIVPMQTLAGPGVIRQRFVTGKAFSDLKGKDAVANARKNIKEALDKAYDTLGLPPGGYGEMENGWLVKVDINPTNFRFDAHGNITSWFDPISIVPPASRAAAQRAGVAEAAQAAEKAAKPRQPSLIRTEAFGQERGALIEQAMQSPRPGYPPRIGIKDAEILGSLPREARVRINCSDLGYSNKEMSVDEALTLLQRDVDSVNVAGVVGKPGPELPPIPTTVKVEPQVRDLVEKSDPTDLFTVRIDYASGHAAQLTGNAEMINAALREADVIGASTTAPGWLPSLSASPAAIRSVEARATMQAELRAEFGAGVRASGEAAGLVGREIHHGTIGGFEASVVAGPKNVGKGFGGAGLYVAHGDQVGLAEEFAGKAIKEWKNRLAELPGGFVDGAGAQRGVVLSGHLDPARVKDMRVGTFIVDREAHSPDLARGVLPSNWADDPRLAKLLEDEFEVLVIRPRGLAIDTQEFLILHESATPAVVWDRSATLGTQEVRELGPRVAKPEPAAASIAEDAAHPQTIVRETGEARARIASPEMQARYAEPADMQQATARVRDDFRKVVAREPDGRVTSFYDKLMADPGLGPEQKERIVRAMARTTDHYEKFGLQRAEAGVQGAAGYQEINRLHTLGEIDRVLDAARVMRLSPEETEDAILASIFSDSHKEAGLASLLTHNQDGADAAAVYLARELGSSPEAVERIARIRAFTKEHQIGPPAFMSNMVGVEFARARAVKLGKPPFVTPLDQLATEEERQLLASIKAKIADPLNPAHLNASGDAIAFTAAEQHLLDEIGIREWVVPRTRAAHAVIAGDSAINYASPEGTAKIVSIRGPGTTFADKTAQDSAASAFASAADARTVLHPELHALYDSQVEATRQALMRAEARIDEWLRSVGRDPAATPFWRGTPLTYAKPGAEKSADEVFAVELRAQFDRFLREEQSHYMELAGSRGAAPASADGRRAVTAQADRGAKPDPQAMAAKSRAEARDALNARDPQLLQVLEAGRDYPIRSGQADASLMAMIQRATDREVALLRLENRVLPDGRHVPGGRVLRLGEAGSVDVRGARRVVAHSQPDAALDFSAGDVAALEARGAHSSLVVNPAGDARRLNVAAEHRRIASEGRGGEIASADRNVMHSPSEGEPLELSLVPMDEVPARAPATKPGRIDEPLELSLVPMEEVAPRAPALWEQASTLERNIKPRAEREAGLRMPDNADRAAVRTFRDLFPDAPDHVTVYRYVRRNTPDAYAEAEAGIVRPWGPEAPLDIERVISHSLESRWGDGVTSWSLSRRFVVEHASDGDIILVARIPSDRLIVPPEKHANLPGEWELLVHGPVTNARPVQLRAGRRDAEEALARSGEERSVDVGGAQPVVEREGASSAAPAESRSALSDETRKHVHNGEIEADPQSPYFGKWDGRGVHSWQSLVEICKRDGYVIKEVLEDVVTGVRHVKITRAGTNTRTGQLVEGTIKKTIYPKDLSPTQIDAAADAAVRSAAKGEGGTKYVPHSTELRRDGSPADGYFEATVSGFAARPIRIQGWFRMQDGRPVITSHAPGRAGAELRPVAPEDW